jgi:glycosyltransferase involved in cell wall biosynthesis
MPVYNAQAFVFQAVESVRRQCHPGLEIVAIDDGSTDSSAELLKGLPDVQLFRQRNAGIAAARNAGIDRARGHWLAFIDADDLWCEDKLAIQLQAVGNCPEIQIVGGQVESFFDAAYAGRNDVALRQSEMGYSAGAMLIRKNDFLRVGKFDTSLRVGEFIDWHSRAISLGLREHVVNALVLRRRIHGDNTTLRQRAAYGDFASVVKSHLNRKRSATQCKVPGTA